MNEKKKKFKEIFKKKINILAELIFNSIDKGVYLNDNTVFFTEDGVDCTIKVSTHLDYKRKEENYDSEEDNNYEDDDVKRMMI